MLLAWIAYTLAVGTLAAAAAFAVERIVALWHGPRRFVWMAAIILSVALPLALATRTPARARMLPRRGTAMPVARLVQPTTATSRRADEFSARLYRWSRRLDQPTRMVWLGASVLLLGVALVAMARIAAKGRRWERSKLGGHDILVTDDVGPAVVGYVRPRMVIPRWALQLGPLERRLMLHHELEHLSADDPRLLLIALLLLVVFPWNAALWWMTQRLRLAIEIDCDARVVQSCGAPREYGLFLLAVGERRSHPLFLAASLAERQSSLERRIRAMTSQRPRRPLLIALPFAALALGAVALAAQTPQPPAPATARTYAGTVSAARVPANRIELSAQQVRELVAARHPGIVAGTTEDNTVTIVLGPNGEILATAASRSTGGVLRAEAGIVAFRNPEEVSDAERAARAKMERGTVLLRTTGPSGEVATNVSSDERAARAKAETTLVMLRATEQSAGTMHLVGIGDIDGKLVQDMYWKSYEPGQVGPSATRVRFVMLTVASIK